MAVIVRDRRERMLRCLAALLVQDHRAFDILVIDNCSVDGTAEAVRSRARSAPVPVRVVEMPGSVGRLRNAAVELAGGEVVAFTDSDCAPEPGWLTGGVAALAADPRLGVVQGCTLPDEDRPGPWANTQTITGESLLFECCNIFYRVEAIRDAAGFDEDPRLSAFGEDTAAGWSVLRRGWRSGYEPAAVVRHDVTYPGLSWHLARAFRYEVFPKLAGEYPEMRERLFWRRWFLSRRYAAFLAAMSGVLLAPFWRPALLLGAPYAWFRRPRRLAGADLRGQLEGTLYDVAGFAGLVRGSVRYRQVVL